MKSATAILALLQLQPGQRAFRDKDWPSAQRLFAEAIRLEPANPAAHKWLGMTFAAQEKYLDAELPFRRSCELAPADPDTCYYWGRTLFTLSRFEAALAAFDKSKPAPRVILGQALAHEGLDHFRDAERLYKQAIASGYEQARADYERFRRKQSVSAGTAVTAVRFDPKALPFTVRNGARGAKRLIETMLSGVAVIDFDNDGWEDIFISTGEGSNGLLRNNRDGTFTDVAEKAGVRGPGWSMGAAAADYDNDGFTDLYVTGVRETRLYRNQRDGTFSAVPFPQSRKWSVSAIWFDYDNDRLLDLFEVRYVEYDEAKETYCGTPQHRQYCHPKLYAPLANALYRNLGGGRFEDVSGRSGIARHEGKGMGAALGDFDNDGWLDLFVANDTVPNLLLHQSAPGRFENIALSAGVAYNESGTAISSMGAELRDIDNDGHEDLWITALSNETFPLFRNQGSGFFRDITLESGLGKASLPWTGWSNAIADFNNDGWKDLFTANGHVMDNAEATSGRQSRQPNQLYLNRQKSFEAVTLAGEAFHRGLAWGDFDRDGRLDLVVTRLNESAQVLWNRTAPAGNWIAFDLEGTKSNRDGIGAMIEVRAGSAKQWNRRTAASGYGATSSRLVHFGLGSAPAVDGVTVRWPSGAVQTLGRQPVNRIVKVVEPAR